MTKLSVNLNKVALLRNSRGGTRPDVLAAARICIDAGADGITLHPRPDQRHAKPADVLALRELLDGHEGLELNVEGNPFPEFLDLVRRAKPDQCTLVPDEPGQLTSDHGWQLANAGEWLRPIIDELREWGIRVSLFMDPVLEEIERAKEVGADRIELYTEPYAKAFPTRRRDDVFRQFAAAAKAAQDLSLGVNAGHDLDLDNLGLFCTIPGLLEVSIGHALIADALEMGLENTVKSYLRVISTATLCAGRAPTTTSS